MKKFKIILLLLAIVLVAPFSVFANETDTQESKEVKVYFFHGDGCGFCANANAWFQEIEQEYGDKFEVVSYEVWYNEENSNLMSAVAEVRKETPGGVPYIVIGNQSWDGFSDDSKESILSKINSEFEQEPSERYDIMNFVDLTNMNTSKDKDGNNTARDILVLLVLVGVAGAVLVGALFARKHTS